MKKTADKRKKNDTDELKAEYNFDYTKAKPNRFAGRDKEDRVVVVLDSDISKVFKTPEAVNKVLRALITTMPEVKGKKAA